MAPARMHADELEIDEALVRRLLAEQFPRWAELPLSRVEPQGTVNAIFRLGDELAVRLPRLAEWSADDGELRLLPRLAPLLPLEIPRPLALGEPGAGYPCRWLVVTWLAGETAPVTELVPVEAAHDLAAFVAALQQADADGVTAGRDRLAERDARTREHVARLGAVALAAWERALAAPSWEKPPVWQHGDLDCRNWLVRDGRISGVIDWGSPGAGDPAADVMVAWKLHSPEAREAFRDALDVDDDTWTRARGWVVVQAAMILGYYTPENNPELYREAESWLEQVLVELAE